MRSLLLLLAATACTGSGPGSDRTPDDEPVVESACDPDLAVFTEHVWEPVLDGRCTTCHTVGSGTAAASSAFQLNPDDLEASMRSAIQVADRLVDKPTGVHTDGHGGGTVVSANSREGAALAFWRDFVLDGACDPPEPWVCADVPAERELRRLTHHEYDRTIQALLKTDAHPAESFPADDVVDGFHNDARALVVPDLLAARYAETAEALAAAADLDALLPCDPREVGRSACAMIFVEDFGYRAFRRPLTQDDVDRYHALWEAIAVDDGFATGIRWVITAMLQSPHFLYRPELGVKQGDTYVLTDWELASALSYGFWGAPPDETLMDAAAAGELATPEGLAAQVERLAADPRASETAADFVEAWLHLDRLQTVSREGIDAALRDALAAETRALVTDVAASGGSLDDLMQADHTFVGADLAAHYGLDGSGRVDLSGTPYGGLLTQGSVLTAHGRHLGSSPVQRGVAVRERLLCEPLPPPPANVDASPPELDPDQSTRDLYIQHAQDPECAECHDLIDPIGFGFEHFDHLGRFRELDGVHEIDDSGAIDEVPFEGPQELADQLIEDPRFRTCFVQSWRRFTTGAPACADDPGTIGLLAPLQELPGREGFRLRTGDGDVGDSLAVGSRIELELPDDDVPVVEGISVSRSVNDWGGGYCIEVTVLNEGDDAATWSVREPADGTINNSWNCTVTDEGDAWVFTGEGWNATLEPGASAGYGFCANR